MFIFNDDPLAFVIVYLFYGFSAKGRRIGFRIANDTQFILNRGVAGQDFVSFFVKIL